MSGHGFIRRRRRFFIDRHIQGRLLFASFVHVAIVAGVFGAVLFGPPIVSLLTNENNSDTALEGARQLLFLHSRFWPAAVLALLMVALDSIRTSHRIAGPVYRFRTVLAALRRGEPAKEIRLRESDMLQGLADDLNALLQQREGASEPASAVPAPSEEHRRRLEEAVALFDGSKDPEVLRVWPVIREALVSRGLLSRPGSGDRAA